MPRKKSAPPVRANKNEPTIEVKDNDVHVTIDTRRYRIRGLERNTSPHQLRVNILATRDDLVHMDTFDLCKAKSRASFIKATAAELFIDGEEKGSEEKGSELFTAAESTLDCLNATPTPTHRLGVDLSCPQSRQQSPTGLF